VLTIEELEGASRIGAELVAVQYNLVVRGEVRSKLSGVDPALPDITVDLADGDGFELSAMLAVPIGRRALGVGPFVRRWQIDRSKTFTLVDPQGSGEAVEFFEPRNATTEFGVRLVFGL